MTRKHTRRQHRPLVNPITLAITGAAITDNTRLDKLRMLELSAIESFRIGRATRDDWMAVADFLNVMETLARDNVGPEALPSCLAAQEALGAVHVRWQACGSLVMTGPQLQALREAYEYADLQRTSISRSRYEQAIQKTAARIRSAPADLKVCMG